MWYMCWNEASELRRWDDIYSKARSGFDISPGRSDSEKHEDRFMKCSTT